LNSSGAGCSLIGREPRNLFVTHIRDSHSSLTFITRNGHGKRKGHPATWAAFSFKGE
jgi:hypothetical protein